MATANMEETDRSVSTDGQPIESRYWVWHLVFVAIYPALILLFFLYLILEPMRLGAIAGVIYFLFALILFVAAWGSLFGYWVEAKRLREVEADWVPFKWAYIIGQFILSPFIVAPIYLFQRWRRIGIPWDDIGL